MALFQFTAVDAAGQEKHGTIEAVTQQDACSAIARYGLRPTQVFAVNQDQGQDPFPDMPAPPAVPASVRTRSSAGVVVSIILSSLALLLALVALCWHFFRASPTPDGQGQSSKADPLGKGLDAYSFKTPRDAYQSELRILASKDFRAQLELEELRRGPELAERLRTLTVRSEATWKGTAILFVSYEKNGEKKFLTEYFKQDPRTKRWVRTVAVNPVDLESDDPTLARQITNWETTGQLN